MPAPHPDIRPNPAGHAAGKTSRRVLLANLALIAVAASSLPLHAEHTESGLVSPPARLDDVWLVDQTGRRRLLSDFLLQRITVLQTIYTGCNSVCPLQAALFGAVQERLPGIGARHPIQLLSIGIDALSDSPPALQAWLKRSGAGPAWTAATPSLRDVDRLRTALAGTTRPLGNIAEHATQTYCFDAGARLRWRSRDLPRTDDVCDVLGALGRV